MSTEFEWTSPDSDQGRAKPPSDRANKRWPWMLALLFLLCGSLLALLYRSSHTVDEEMLRAVELYVEAEKRAVSAGDDTIFFSMQEDDPAWRASQIWLARDLVQAKNIEVTHVEKQGDYVWATLTSMMDSSPIHRQAFFWRSDARLLHAGSDPSFWGPEHTQSYSWGKLRLHRVDSEWEELVNEFVTVQSEALCQDGCVEGRRPFTLVLSSNYDATAVEGELRIPSPRLIGLNGAGRPSPLFWKRLANELNAYLRPATIRFAAPEELAGPLHARAAEFTAQNPDISVEIIPFSQLPAEPDEMLTRVDGAYLQPRPSMIASADIHDLTSLAETDASADIEDFYRPILAAAHWRGRLWALPLSAEMPVIYFDRPSFMVATLAPEDYLFQIWQQSIRRQSDPLQSLRTESDGWGLLDAETFSLYAYAYAQRCADGDVQPCTTAPLREEDLAAALAWYNAHVAQEGNMPDLTSMDDDERAFRVLNWLDGWGFLDAETFSLYAYAYAQRCVDGDVQPCTAPLREEDLAAALAWYYFHVVQEGNMPDLTSMDDEERVFRVLNWLSVPRDVPMWVDLPGFYEHTRQLGGIGVLPMQAQTGDDRVKGPTPLQIHSGVISRSSENPVAVWKWLMYLSRQRPIGPVRSIPARRSVAEEIDYWETLPPELREPMSEAFKDARPVGIADGAYFDWSALENLVNGSAGPEALAEQMMETIWFQFD